VGTITHSITQAGQADRTDTITLKCNSIHFPAGIDHRFFYIGYQSFTSHLPYFEEVNAFNQIQSTWIVP
jgi:hypothetical protein